MLKKRSKKFVNFYLDNAGSLVKDVVYSIYVSNEKIICVISFHYQNLNKNFEFCFICHIIEHIMTGYYTNNCRIFSESIEFFKEVSLKEFIMTAICSKLPLVRNFAHNNDCNLCCFTNWNYYCLYLSEYQNQENHKTIIRSTCSSSSLDFCFNGSYSFFTTNNS